MTMTRRPLSFCLSFRRYSHENENDPFLTKLTQWYSGASPSKLCSRSRSKVMRYGHLCLQEYHYLLANGQFWTKVAYKELKSNF